MKNNDNPIPLNPLFMILEVSRFGEIKGIFPVAQNEREEKLLMEALNRWRSAKGREGNRK